MIPCTIKVFFVPGVASIELTRDFPSTCDAVAEALAMFPDAVRVSVVCLRSEA